MSKQVSRISPYFPIAVLLAIQAFDNYHLLHVVLGHPLASTVEQGCPARTGAFALIPPLNKICCILSNAFEIAMGDPVCRVVLAEFSVLIAAVAVISHIAANRASASWPVKYGATIVLVLGQLLGVANIMPIFYALIIWRSSASARASFLPSGVSRALLPAIVVGYFFLTAPMLVPDMFTKGTLRMTMELWQPFPIYLAALMAVLGSYFYAISNRQLTASDAVISTSFLVSTTDFLVLCSLLTHGLAIYFFVTLRPALKDFIPNLDMRTATDVYRTFFLFDFIGCLTATWTLIFYDTTRFAGLGRASPLAAVVVAIVGTLILGPGGAVAWAWASVEKARLSALVADRKPSDRKISS
ncbi:hypothetical protein BCR37DRAFT_394459 [Protomyces lactucae-debilis]|uniref:Uncharacterized protein n=1 Tax=Protomyces lactucae-debilis TaxID=2754530 RepID=A0A1Y2F493_PROLT|nr:uncharacterized protein BCR37DRAFT_394459 [Protomyces lactucae-debilis]ORY78507.1 hypothetical protein BCR37DRAFT_394459 [Protomyces lactucae-debilis]